jgi:hypothetical protein
VLDSASDFDEPSPPRAAVQQSTSDILTLPLDDSEPPAPARPEKKSPVSALADSDVDVDMDVSFGDIDTDLGLSGSPEKPAAAARQPAPQAPPAAVKRVESNFDDDDVAMDFDSSD